MFMISSLLHTHKLPLWLVVFPSLRLRCDCTEGGRNMLLIWLKKFNG